MGQDFKTWWHEHVRLRRFALKRRLSGKFVCSWKGHDMSERLYSIDCWGAEGRGQREQVYAICSRCGNRGELLEVLPLPGNTRDVSEDPFIATAEQQRQAQEIAERIREGLNRGEFTWAEMEVQDIEPPDTTKRSHILPGRPKKTRRFLMIDCASCGSVLILSGGSFTSSLVSVTDKMDSFGNRDREYNCECGHTTSPAARIINEPKQKQVEPEETIQGQLAGVREFNVTDDGDLGGLFYGGVWEPDKSHRATCAKGEAIGLGRSGSYAIRIGSWDDHYTPRKPHRAPAFGCQCGFHSFNSLKEAEKAGDGFQFPRRIRAVVSAWGDVIICEHGFRAEWMQIEAIIKQPTFAWGVEIDATAAWARIAARYSVPVVETSEVAEFREALGTVVDGPGERARAEVEVRNQFLRRRQELIGSLDEFGKSAGKTLEDNRFQAFLGAVDKPKRKPAFWRDLPSNTKKGRDFGV